MKLLNQKALKMKIKFIFRIYIIILSFATITLSACNKEHSDIMSYEEAVQKLIEFNSLSEYQKLNSLSLLDTLIVSIKEETLSNKKNIDALYYLGIATQIKLNKGSEIVNFDNISLHQTREISNIFKKIGDNNNINPNFRFSQFSKLTQIWGNLAINYVLKGVPDSADYAFLEGKKQNGFPDANLEYCRNILNSLEPNAILFVASEVELFNFMYVQCEENIRIDVTVISIFYLQYYWYATWLNFLPNLTQPINTNCSDEFMKSTYKFDSTYVNAPQRLLIDGNSTEFNVNGRNNNKYLTSEEIIMLEIIKFNANKRTVYFNQTITQTYASILGLNNNIISEGMVYKVVGGSNTLMNYDKTITNLLNKFKFDALINQLSSKDRDKINLIDEYKTAFMQTIIYNLQNLKDKKSLESILSKLMLIFPEATTKWDNEELNLINSAREFIKSDSTIIGK